MTEVEAARPAEDDSRGAAPEEGAAPPYRSFAEDLEALLENGRTYLEAEYAYQKSRASFAASSGLRGVVLVVAALAFVHLALIALVVGITIALMPLIGPFGATFAVAGVLLAVAAILILLARSKFVAIPRVLKDNDA